MECGVVQVSRSGLSDLSLRWDARDLGHLVRTKNPDLPRLLFVNESPGGGDPNVLASSHADRVTANSVYGKRLPFWLSEVPEFVPPYDMATPKRELRQGWRLGSNPAARCNSELVQHSKLPPATLRVAMRAGQYSMT